MRENETSNKVICEKIVLEKFVITDNKCLITKRIFFLKFKMNYSQ